MNRTYSIGVSLCIVAAVSWGGMFPVMNSAMRFLDPFTFTCLRYGIALILFVVVLAFVERSAGFRITRRDRPWLAWFFGTSGFAGFQFLVFYGEKLLGVSGVLIASVMMATQPFLGMILNRILGRMKPPLGAFGFVAISFVGVALVITKGDFASIVREPGDYAADGLIVLGALCWVVYTTGGSFYPQWSPLKYTTITTALGLPSAIVITLVLIGSGALPAPTFEQVGHVIPELLYMGVVAGFVGVLSWNSGNRIITTLNGVLFMDVVPITSFAITMLQGHIPHWVQLLGAAVTAVALILNNIYIRRHQIRAPTRQPLSTAKGVVAAPTTLDRDPVKATP